MPEIRKPTREMIERVIETGNLNDLLYLQETSWFEFRERHYATTSPNPGGFKAKYELAKDCSSIANSGGGYIFIGLEPSIQQNQMTEFVSAIVGIAKADINLPSWRDSLLASLMPRFTLEDMEYGFIDINDTKAVLWVRIPAASDKGVYPLILHSDQAQEGGHQIKGRVIGVYERYGAENSLMSPEKIQGFISQGVANEKNDQPFAQDISRIEAKLDLILDGQTSPRLTINAEERLRKLNTDARRKLGESDEPYFYIYAAPKTKVSFLDFWAPYSDSSSIPRLMKDPPKLRSMGWDLSVAIQEHPSAESGAWEVANGNRKLLNVTEKGEVFVGATINDFLDWGMDNPDQRQHNPGYSKLINEYAFAEFIAMYFAFLEKVSERFEGNSEGVAYDILFGFTSTNGASIGLHEPFMSGFLSNGTIGPLREPANWRIDDINPKNPYVNAGTIIQEIIRAGFGGEKDPVYFVRDKGRLVFNPSIYTEI